MRVGIVLSQPCGNSVGTDVRVNGLIKGLSSLGIEIHLIAPESKEVSAREYNVNLHGLKSFSSSLQSSRMNQFTKKILGNPWFFRNIACNKQIMNHTVKSYAQGVYEVIKNLDLDLLQAEQPIAACACTRLKNKISIPVIADFHGIWCEELIASNAFNYDDVGYRTIFNLEREIAQTADASSVVSDEMKYYLEENFKVPASKVAVIPNAAFTRYDKAFYDKNSSSKIVHSGTLHPWEKVELFIESISFVSKAFPETKFYLTRKGAKLEKIMRLSKKLNVNPEFFWFTQNEELFDFLHKCNVGVISSTNHIARKMAYPAKLYDYLSVGLPIVANNIGGWTKIITENKLGIVTDNTPEAYASGILELVKNPELALEYGQNGIDLVTRELNYYKTAEKLLKIYKQLD